MRAAAPSQHAALHKRHFLSAVKFSTSKLRFIIHKPLAPHLPIKQDCCSTDSPVPDFTLFLLRDRAVRTGGKAKQKGSLEV